MVNLGSTRESNGTVHYLGGYERKLADTYNSETITKYYSASLGAMSRPVAFRRGGTLHWVGSDHLGGTIRVLDGSFTALDGMRYKPYGEDRDTGSSLNTDRKFTGQTEDEAAGLYWYASRAYDPAIGRFVSPDPIVPAPGNPQSLNRYSYVYNNPLKFVDPSGYAPGDWDPDWVRRFEDAHDDRGPTDKDWADYQFSLRRPGSGSDGAWTPQDWVNYSTPPAPAPNIQDHKANLAENYNPTIVLADQAREDHLAENYNTTIHPRDPLDGTPESIFDQVISSIPDVQLGLSHSIHKAITDISIDRLAKRVDVTDFVRHGEFIAKRVGPLGRALDYGLTFKEEKEAGSSNTRAFLVAVTTTGLGWGGGIIGGIGGTAAGGGAASWITGPAGVLLVGYAGSEGGKLGSRAVLDFFGVR